MRAISRSHSTNTAAAARRALSAFFAWAIADGLLGDGANPVDGSHRPADPEPRDHVLTDAELVNVWRACRDDDFGRIVRLLILLGARRQEVGGMRWDEIDLDAGSGACRRSEARMAASTSLPCRKRLWPSCRQRRAWRSPVRLSRRRFYLVDHGKQALDGRLAGTVRPWRLHDIRRSVATNMADIGIEPHVIEACLNHFSGHRRGIAGIYNRCRYERATAAAFMRWAEHIMALVEGRDSKVIPLRA